MSLPADFGAPVMLLDRRLADLRQRAVDLQSIGARELAQLEQDSFQLSHDLCDHRLLIMRGGWDPSVQQECNHIESSLGAPRFSRAPLIRLEANRELRRAIMSELERRGFWGSISWLWAGKPAPTVHTVEGKYKQI